MGGRSAARRQSGMAEYFRGPARLMAKLSAWPARGGERALPFGSWERNLVANFVVNLIGRTRRGWADDEVCEEVGTVPKRARPPALPVQRNHHDTAFRQPGPYPVTGRLASARDARPLDRGHSSGSRSTIPGSDGRASLPTNRSARPLSVPPSSPHPSPSKPAHTPDA